MRNSMVLIIGIINISYCEDITPMNIDSEIYENPNEQSSIKNKLFNGLLIILMIIAVGYEFYEFIDYLNIEPSVELSENINKTIFQIILLGMKMM